MAYSDTIKNAVHKAPRNLGSRLGVWAIHRDFSVSKIAACTGATRQTVYNWIQGGEIIPAYVSRVKAITAILETSDNSTIAWRQACKTFNITK